MVTGTELTWPQMFVLGHVGMASATGFPIDIPILTRSLAASIFKTRVDAGEPFGLDFSILKTLDAGTPAGDPSALVDRYKFDWWHSTSPPFPTEILCSPTLSQCLETHRQFTTQFESVTTFEKQSYLWGRGLHLDGPGDEQCRVCPRLRAIAVGAYDEFRQLRQMVDALETQYDVERDLTNRRTASFHAMFEAAVVKETEADGLPFDSSSGICQERAAVKEVFGMIRQPKKGPEIVRQVREAAEHDLRHFQSRPELKWTWGVDLDRADLVDLAGAAYNGKLEEANSGYDTELADGTKTGEDSPDPVHPTPGAPFEALSPDIMDIRLLADGEIPHHFNFYPLRKRRDPPVELGEILERYYRKQAEPGGQRLDFQNIVSRLPTPDLEITDYMVPDLPISHLPQSLDSVSVDENHMDITLDWDKTAPVPVFWETPLPSSLPPFSRSASEDIRQLGSSPLDARSARSRPAPEYTDSEDEIRPRPLTDTFSLDAAKAAAAFLSVDEHDPAGAEYVSRAPFSRSVSEDIRQLASSPLDAKSARRRPPPEYTDSEDEIRPAPLADTFPLDALTAAAAFLTDDEEDDDPAGPDCVSRDATVAPDNTDLAAAWFSDSDISLPGPARTPNVPVISEVLPLVSSALDADGNNMDSQPAGQQTPVAFQASHSELASLFLESDESDDDTDSDSSSTSRMSDHGVNKQT